MLIKSIKISDFHIFLVDFITLKHRKLIIQTRKMCKKTAFFTVTAFLSPSLNVYLYSKALENVINSNS
jgi:hypothetical protein